MLKALNDGLGGLVAIKYDRLAVQVAERAVGSQHMRYLAGRSRFWVNKLDDGWRYEIKIGDRNNDRYLQARLVKYTSVVQSRQRVVSREFALPESIVNAAKR